MTILPYPWWINLVFFIGVAGMTSALAALFASFGRRPWGIIATEIPTVESPDFLRAMALLTNSFYQQGGQAKLLVDGDEFYPALYADLKKAEASINFTVYSWQPGLVSDTIFDILIERARAGIEVRVLADAKGGFRIPDSSVRELKAAGGSLIFFRPFRLGTIFRYHKRNHRRAIVIDGKIAYTGGAAVGDKWQGRGSNPDEWHDTMVRFTGRAALGIQSSFTQLWSGTEGEILVGSRFYPVVEDEEQGSNDLGYHICLNSSPSSGDHPLRKFFWFSFSAAREKLYITNSYFAPDPHIVYAIKNRAANGVDVRLLVPSQHTDAPLVRWTGQSYFEELLSAGARIYEYQPSMLHSKHVVVDSLWSIVGSANIDIRSKELNEENVVGVLDANFALEIEKLFLKDLDKAREITLSDWQSRPWWWKLRERVASLLAEQL